MRIVIDLQGAQGDSRYRGIGRYSLALAQAMVRNRGEHEILIALNGMFPESIEPIRAAFEGLLPADNIRVWASIDAVDEQGIANDTCRKMAELVRESFLSNLKPDVILISSLFEGFDENAVTSIGHLGSPTPIAVVLYDLIPLIYRDVYLQKNVSYEHWYENKVDHLRRADLLLSISSSAGREATEYLGFPEKMVVNISTACDAIFRPVPAQKSQKEYLSRSYNITKPFVLYAGGIDQRKNIDGLFRAFVKLPSTLREKYQLVLIGKELLQLRAHFIKLAQDCGLAENELVLTGYIEDNELALLYNACTLFVFPSWHEGFGLPVLEAMSCGRAVIATNTSSLPEVVGREDALFPPHNVAAISAKMVEVLTNDSFRAELERHGLAQASKFSWDITAKHAWDALYSLHIKHRQLKQSISGISSTLTRPRLAYISPLPPERTGIADYSAELLPELSRHYEIEVIIAQGTVTQPWVEANCPIRSVEWFKANTNHFDRVIYHFGNSPFHSHMFELVREIPGTIVLHDFFLSGIVAHMDVQGYKPDSWLHELYHAHGYQALSDKIHSTNWDNEAFKYPCNKTIFENAQGVIVHSNYSRQLADKWLGENFAEDWSVIPLLRTPAKIDKKSEARIALGINEDIFLICSFGLLGSTKQNHRLLTAWLSSSLSKDKHCQLVFVGENHGGDYGTTLTSTIHDHELTDRIRITGWTDTTQFHQYLAAADMGVQLRTHSRGETSAAVLDCMNYALPTIVNANGSMADLSAEAVWMLPDEFDDADLTKTLEALWKDKAKRNALGKRAREVILSQHAPRTCADQYCQAIEHNYSQAQSGKAGLIKAISNIENPPTDETEWLELAQAISLNNPSPTHKQLLIDISALVQHDLKTGIERVVRSILKELLANPPEGYRVEPVYAKAHEQGYYYARQFTLRFLDCPSHLLVDEPIEFSTNDIFLGLDLQQHIVTLQTDFYIHLKNMGVQTYFVIYDLLPVLRPDFFPEGASHNHAAWLNTIAQTDGVLCISSAVAEEMVDWLNTYGSKRLRPLKVGWFHLGADVNNSAPTAGLPANADEVLSRISNTSTFLMVGTIEPRKGHLQTLSAFERLWEKNINTNLVIVGHEGWKPLPDTDRRTIPEIIENIRNHPELNRRLFWLEGISDEYLEKIYATSTCLIAASEGEGFGLPLIEAAQHKLPIIARDIPVFCEVAGKHAFYFSGMKTVDLANAVTDWLVLNKAGKAPQSTSMPWLTWKQSTQNLLDVIVGNQWHIQWMSDNTHPHFQLTSPPKEIATKINLEHLAQNEHLSLIHAARIEMVSTLLPSGNIILDLGGANCPLYKMGYPYPFTKLTLIDLPPDQRHDYYKDIIIDADCPLGLVVVRYTDMTTLEGIADESVDFVWSGESIEHVPLEAGQRMAKEAFRVLKKGGTFCLDTPNRHITKIHTASVGGGFIHPEHYIEYYPDQLQNLLKTAGFTIQNSYGICEMPLTVATGVFRYEDFLTGKNITHRVTDSYIQFHHCIKN